MTALATIYSTDEIWGWLADVPDPEIPVVSIVDLGIVRGVKWAGETLVVAVTPTYSGCPATAYIAGMIDAAIRARGIHDLKIETQLSPPWTTDWISEEGRKKLKAYGIAPPVEGSSCAGAMKADALERDAKKSEPVFRKNHETNKNPAQNVDSGLLHFAPVACPHCGSTNTEEVSRFGSTPCKASWRCKDCLEPFDYFKSF